MSPIHKNASSRIADWLVDRGVEQVFAVTGGGAMFLNHALASHPKLRCTFMHHEQACAMAAEGYARIAGKPALVNVTTGPGGINALNGVFGAYTDSIPMIVLSGQVKRETWLVTSPVQDLRQLGDQEAPIVAMARPITKCAINVKTLEDLAEGLPRAFHMAITGRPGPVWLDIPIDLQSSTVAFEFSGLPTEVSTRDVAVRDGARRVVELLRQSHRPIVLAGTGVRLAGAGDALLGLVEETGVPVATAWTHDLVPSSHPLYAGRPGTIGTRAGNLCMQSADLVLVIGSRLNIRQVSYNWSSFAKNAKIVQVDIDSAEFEKPLVRPQLTIVADALAFIQEMKGALATTELLPDFSRWAEWCRATSERYPACERSNVSTGSINPYAAVTRVFEALPDRAVVACGNASACILPFQVGALRKDHRMFSNSGSASMGYELPSAIGAAVADPSRRVICMAGDGSLQMNVQELQTLVTLGLNVAVVVLANDGYLSIRSSHENFFGRVVGADRASGVDCPDYVALGKAYGLRTLDIREESDLSKLEEAVGLTGPILIQVHVDPMQGFSPKLKSRMDESGRFLTPELDDLFPFLSSEELEEVRASARSIRATPA